MVRSREFLERNWPVPTKEGFVPYSTLYLAMKEALFHTGMIRALRLDAGEDIAVQRFTKYLVEDYGGEISLDSKKRTIEQLADYVTYGIERDKGVTGEETIKDYNLLLESYQGFLNQNA